MTKLIAILTLVAVLACGSPLAGERQGAGTQPAADSPETRGTVLESIYGVEYSSEAPDGRKMLGRLFVFPDARQCRRWAAQKGRACENAKHLPTGWSAADAVPATAD
ncbi:MAG: hypothetical protein WCO00_03130 [Rhodospirillaceae bacterium]